MRCGTSNYPLLTMAYTVFLSGILLYPFDFEHPAHRTKNHVAWLEDRDGVEFNSTGIISSNTSMDDLGHALVSRNGFTAEMWLSVSDRNQAGPARILSYSLDTSRRNFTIGQHKQDLVIRLRTEKTDLNGIPEKKINNVFVSDDPLHLAVVLDSRHGSIFINGEKKTDTLFAGDTLSNWNHCYPLIIGNEKTGNRPWKGRLYLVALYNRPLSSEEVNENYSVGWFVKANDVGNGKRVLDGLVGLYLFNERTGNVIKDSSGSKLAPNLHIPKDLLNKKLLSYNFEHGYPSMYDVVLNLMIFIPFGFLLRETISGLGYSAIKTIAIVIVAGFVLSVTLESLQYFLKNHTSSLADVISRLIGVASGSGFRMQRG